VSSPSEAVSLRSPFDIGRRRLHTRLVLPPMASGTADERGVVTPELLAHYDRIVSAHHGLAWVEYTYVHPSGRSEPRQPGMHTDEHERGMAQVAALIRTRGALAGLQLTHAGAKTEPELIGGGRPVGASPIEVPAHRAAFDAPDELTEFQAYELIDAFVASAARAVRAGFAAVEIHAAHGYLLNQWVSPLTNQRVDAHGGSLVARSRLLVEIVRRVRAAVGDQVIVSVRFPGQDRLAGGIDAGDGITLARLLVDAGVDVLNVSSGLGGWRRGREQRGEGYLVPDAARIRAEVGVPVIGVGGIETHEYARAVLARGDVDLVAVGRAVLADPSWADRIV
jgi:NADPH2 dehydrogenase